MTDLQLGARHLDMVDKFNEGLFDNEQAPTYAASRVIVYRPFQGRLIPIQLLHANGRAITTAAQEALKANK